MNTAEIEREVIDRIINRIKERAELAEIKVAIAEAIRENDEIWEKRMLLLLVIAVLALLDII
ncbi:hypothetical protein FACS1894122_06710 [Alphaproteobacteria bacterium]|nr:hypothetical protein FACS1894122_06710 [Alphaproteobacteria bacterium]